MSLDIHAVNKHMTHGLSCESLEHKYILEQRRKDKELLSVKQYVKKQNVNSCLIRI